MVKSKKSAAAMMLVFVLMVALVGPHAAAKLSHPSLIRVKTFFPASFSDKVRSQSSFLKYGIPRLSKRLIRMN